jgi:hypothetical protein
MTRAVSSPASRDGCVGVSALVQQPAGGAQDWHAAVQAGWSQADLAAGPAGSCAPVYPRPGATVSAYGAPSTSGPIGSIDCAVRSGRASAGRSGGAADGRENDEYPAIVIRREGIGSERVQRFRVDRERRCGEPTPVRAVERKAACLVRLDRRLWGARCERRQAGARRLAAMLVREIPIAHLGSRRVGGRHGLRSLDLSAGCGEPDDRVAGSRTSCTPRPAGETLGFGSSGVAERTWPYALGSMLVDPQCRHVHPPLPGPTAAAPCRAGVRTAAGPHRGRWGRR